MRNKNVYVLLILGMLVFSCSIEKTTFTPNNLQEYLNEDSGLIADEVIACAASDASNNLISYIFYYPIDGATDILYFETESVNVNEKDFSLYKQRTLPTEAVFNGYLERFVRNDHKEVWSIVTYKTDGKLHKSNPIRLKHQTKPTEWSANVSIDLSQKNSPKFIWKDGVVKENAIYFQVLTDENNNLLSGTYTYDFWYQYYVLDNVVLNITKTTPPVLIEGDTYNFTMMGVSLDNWVNLVIQKQFLNQ